jgi:hypothetical protein
MIARVHHHRVGDEQQVELAALGNARDLLHDRQLHMAGGGAFIPPAGGMVARPEDEHPHMHLTPAAHAPRPPLEPAF